MKIDTVGLCHLSTLVFTVRPDWSLAHIAGMGGAYTATVTAFLVVNIGFLSKPVIFIAPSLIGTALIAWMSVRDTSRTHL